MCTMLHFVKSLIVIGDIYMYTYGEVRERKEGGLRDALLRHGLLQDGNRRGDTLQ